MLRASRPPPPSLPPAVSPLAGGDWWVGRLTAQMAQEDPASVADLPLGGSGGGVHPMSPKELALPEQEFTYQAGSADRPWDHFLGRWRAIAPRLAEVVAATADGRPLRLVDVGSCTGFFSLQAANSHAEVDVIAVEGSVGIGNGSVGMARNASQILGTPAVKTHLRWIRKLQLQNCLLAPEVWDYAHVCELALLGKPVCDVMFLLSVVHHMDGVSVQQYTAAGLSRLDGVMDLLAKLLALAPRHFVELPNKPWIECAYQAYSTQRKILEAAAKRSKYERNFVGPIYQSDWFGQRELWLLEVSSHMPAVDLQACPFPCLVRADDVEDTSGVGGSQGPSRDLPPLDATGFGGGGGFADTICAAAGGLADPLADFDCSGLYGGLLAGAHAPLLRPTASGGGGGGRSAPAPHIGGMLMEPAFAVMAAEPCPVVSDAIGKLLCEAPTSLLVAHLALREAIGEAQDIIREVHEAGIIDRDATQQLRRAAPSSAGSAGPLGAAPRAGQVAFPVVAG